MLFSSVFLKSCDRLPPRIIEIDADIEDAGDNLDAAVDAYIPPCDSSLASCLDGGISIDSSTSDGPVPDASLPPDAAIDASLPPQLTLCDGTRGEFSLRDGVTFVPPRNSPMTVKVTTINGRSAAIFGVQNANKVYLVWDVNNTQQFPAGSYNLEDVASVIWSAPAGMVFGITVTPHDVNGRNGVDLAIGLPGRQVRVNGRNVTRGGYLFDYDLAGKYANATPQNKIRVQLSADDLNNGAALTARNMALLEGPDGSGIGGTNIEFPGDLNNDGVEDMVFAFQNLGQVEVLPVLPMSGIEHTSNTIRVRARASHYKFHQIRDRLTFLSIAENGIFQVDYDENGEKELAFSGGNLFQLLGDFADRGEFINLGEEVIPYSVIHDVVPEHALGLPTQVGEANGEAGIDLVLGLPGVAVNGQSHAGVVRVIPHEAMVDLTRNPRALNINNIANQKIIQGNYLNENIGYREIALIGDSLFIGASLSCDNGEESGRVSVFCPEKLSTNQSVFNITEAYRFVLGVPGERLGSIVVSTSLGVFLGGEDQFGGADYLTLFRE